LLSLTSSVIMGMLAPKTVPLRWSTIGAPSGLLLSDGAGSGVKKSGILICGKNRG
jgi:hypothetical protein